MKLDWKKIIGGAIGAALVAASGSYTISPTSDWTVHGGIAAGAALTFIGGLFTKRPQDTAKK